MKYDKSQSKIAYHLYSYSVLRIISDPHNTVNPNVSILTSLTQVNDLDFNNDYSKIITCGK